MIEVLVSMVIIAIGLLGLAGAQLQAQQAELDAYRRAQALVLLQDIANRVRANHSTARCYETDGFIGQGSDPVACSGWGTSDTRQLADEDLTAWNDLLEGRADTLASGAAVGSMPGARGCIAYDVGAEEYTLTVAWQGQSETVVPSNACASGAYGPDARRRTVSRTLAIPELD
jgi:type IV pilus assembly protein PilV